MSARALLPALVAVGEAVRDAVLDACRSATVDQLAAHDDSGPGDTAFAVDRVAEGALLAALATHLGGVALVLVAEGLPDTGHGHGVARLGVGAPAWRLVVDPLDGTRPLAYQKRSAWVLLGLAPEPGDGRVPTLTEVVAAVMVEVPPLKQTYADVLTAVRGGGTRMRRVDLRRLDPDAAVGVRPSTATGLAQGYAQVSRAFPGGRAVLAAVDDAVALALVGPPVPGKAQYFEDQWCSGGALYSLAVGHDRFTADLRPLVPGVGICAHPYDLCAALVATEAGVLVTAPDGSPLDPPLTLDGDVGWVGYANAALRALVEPALQAALREHGLQG